MSRCFIICLVLIGLLPTQAHSVETFSKRPLAKLIERTVTTLEERLVGIKIKNGVHLDLQTGQGVNLNATRKFFFSPVIKKIKQRRTIRLSQKGNTKIRIMVSVNHHRVWIVGTIESKKLIGPSPFVLHELLSDELNYAFGAQRSSSPSLQWRVQPIGEVQGHILDLCVLSWNPEASAFEIAVLDTSGIQIFHYNPEPNTMERFMGHAFLKSTRNWPRIVAGWIGLTSPRTLTATTTRGDTLSVDLVQYRASSGAVSRIPIRNRTKTGHQTHWGKPRPGNPNIQGPIQSNSGKVRTPSRMPHQFRDAHSVGSPAQWYWIDTHGHLQSQSQQKPIVPEPIGDRFLFADLDGDGQKELVHTKASLSHQSDALMVRTIPTSTASSRILYTNALGGGNIVAMDSLPPKSGVAETLIIAEQIPAEQTPTPHFRIWRLEVVQ